MAGIYKTVLNKSKFSRLTAIGIGVLVSIPLLFFGWFMLQGAFTRASDDEPRDVVITGITSNSARVEWTTGQSTQGVVEYGTSEDALVFFAPETEASTTHGVELTLLTPSTTHYFQIKIGDKVYTNSGTGKPWQFTTRTKDGEAVTPTQPAAEVTPVVDVTEIPIATLMPSASPSAFPTVAIPTIAPTSAFIPTSTSIPMPISCNETDCVRIKQKLGLGCTATDYIRCLNKNGVTINPTQSTGTLPTKSPMVDAACAMDSLQSADCKTWTWTNMDTKPEACRTAFFKYVLYCQSSSIISTPGVNPSSIYTYFNSSITAIASNSATLPGSGYTTPGNGTIVYCRVRAEATQGTDTTSTPWVYGSRTCPN